VVRILIACLLLAAPAAAQEASVEQPFGTLDRLGANSMMSESTGVRAANLIRRGRIFSIGRDYATLGAEKAKRALRTTLFGIGALSDDGRYYNGLEESALNSVAMPAVRPFFTRGMMIDMVSLRGRAMRAGEEIGAEEIEEWLEWKDLKPPKPGDVVIFHTGWGGHWGSDDATYLGGAPGIGAQAAEWLIEHRVAIVGADTWAIEAQAPGAEGADETLRRALLVENGIYLLTNLETARIIDAEIAEFAVILSPLPVTGAHASPGVPLIAY
jgi:kynurenine formamidase